MLVVLCSVLGTYFYLYSYGATIKSMQSLSKVSAQPVLNLMKPSVGGGNYANIQDGNAYNLYTSTPDLIFFSVNGQTDLGKTPYSAIYLASEEKLWRTAYSDGYEDKLFKKRNKVAAGIKKYANNPKRLKKLNLMMDKITKELAYYTEALTMQAEVNSTYKRPDADDLKDGFYLDKKNNLLHLVLPTGNDAGGEIWMVLDATILSDTIFDVAMKSALISIICLIVASAISLFFSKQVIAPIKRITATMSELTNGNYDLDIEDYERQDEIGEMARSLQIFQQTSVEKIRIEKAQEKEQKEKERRQKEIQNLVNIFEKDSTKAVNTVAETATSLSISSNELEELVQNIYEKIKLVTAASNNTSENVASVATTTQQMSSDIAELTQQVSSSRKLVNGAVEKTKQSNELAGKLGEASLSINKIIEVIQGIANQINMLALNATIEAARAGDAGRGFAVVAHEVKELASQVGQATDDITVDISNIQNVSQDVISALAAVQDDIEKVGDYTSNIAMTVEEQNSAARIITENINTASAGVSDIDNDVKDIGSSMEQAEKAMGGIDKTALALSSQSDTLRSDISGFLTKINE